MSDASRRYNREYQARRRAIDPAFVARCREIQRESKRRAYADTVKREAIKARVRTRAARLRAMCPEYRAAELARIRQWTLAKPDRQRANDRVSQRRRRLLEGVRLPTVQIICDCGRDHVAELRAMVEREARDERRWRGPQRRFTS